MTLRGVQDAFSSAMPREYFTALFDTTDEAEANYRLHLNRIASAKRQNGSGRISEEDL